ncbi:MAG: SUMF1/EgtB/PvdO family nonheme iron enzyme, partial [Planctomycetia bacterium]|nr:SUMF1/EgtB/PvdO family nonheme iron enzyme [Planctomycetia bacterium]
PGEFAMGSTAAEIEAALKDFGDDKRWEEYIKSAAPQHNVILTQPIYLSANEVTQAEYEKVVGSNPSHFAAMGNGKETVAGLETANHPVEQVSWNDAAEFCAKLSKQEKFKPFYFRAGETVMPLDGTGYRLPSEAEWEFACRAGTTTKYWIGDKDEDLVRAGWFRGNSGGRTHAVGELKANPFGLADIHGNVHEWVHDGWDATYYVQFQEKPAINPSSPFSSASWRVFRGGNWFHISSPCWSSFRDAYDPSHHENHYGFRVLLSVDAVRQALKVTGPSLPKRPKASVTDASTSSTAKPLTPLPPLDLDETDPLPGWELPAGAPPPVVAPCEPTLATERQQLWAEFLKRPVIEEVDVAALALSGMALATGDSGATSAGKSPAASAVPLTKRSEKNANATTLKFALIPPGEFRKIFTRPRDPAIEPDMPVRRFRITKPYAISTTEVTWDQFRQFVEATGYQTEAETNGLGGRDREFKPDPKINWRTPGWKPAPNEPVTQVTPKDAEAFCAWLSKLAAPGRPSSGDAAKDEEKKNKDKTAEGGHPTGGHPTYRLPTEAEWVYACRAGSVHKHVVGPEPKDLDYYAWSQGSPQATNTGTALHPVGIMKPNPFGLHDTLGNVWERTIDLLNGPGSLTPYLGTNDPRGMRDANLAGGSYLDVPSTVHPDFIMSSHPEPGPHIGFRVLKQFDGEPLPGPLDRPLVLRAGQTLSVHALVPRPEKIPGLQSWSIELAGPHGLYSTAIAVSPKSDLIATGGSGFGKISLWDRDGNYQRALLGHEANVNSLDFSPDGRWLASCEFGGGTQGFGGITARVWNVETGALHAVIPFSGWAYKVAFSPNSERLAIAGPTNPLVVLELRTGQTVSDATDAHGANAASVAWSPDGTELACSHGNNHLRVRDAKSLKVLREVEAPASQNLEWSPDGQSLALLTDDRKVAIRDAKTLEIRRTFGSSGIVSYAHSLAWLPDSRRLLVAQEQVPTGVFDAFSGESLSTFVGTGNVASVALLKDGQEAVLEAYGRLVFYDTSTGQKVREGKDRAGTGGGGWCALSRDGREMFNQSWGKIWVNDAATGERLRSYPQSVEASSAPYVSPDGKLLAIAIASLPTMQIVDEQTGAKRHELSHGQGNVTRVAWSPDGKWLATGATDKLVRVWNVATGKIEHELAGHTGTIWSLAWSPDGTRLASAAEDKTVRLWDPLAGKLVATYDQFPEAMAFGLGVAYAGQQLAWTSGSRRLWIALSHQIVPLDVETGTFGPLEIFTGVSVTYLNTSPDGQRLLAREGYGWTFVRGRDAQDRRLLGQHLGHTAQWHPDSRRFLGSEWYYGTVGFDVETNRRLGLLFPWLTGDHWLCLGPTGHYRGS